MADVTLYPQTPIKDDKQEETKEEVILSPSVNVILENPLFAIDPLLLIRICSFLDMLSVMRFQCISIKLTKFLKRSIQLQSLQQSNTDYYIDHALHSVQVNISYHILARHINHHNI